MSRDARTLGERQDAQAWGRKRSGPKSSVKRRVYKRDGLRCAECGKEGRPAPNWTVDDARAGLLKLTIDHIVPLSRGGTNNESNLRVMCSDCNGRKGNRL